MSLQDAGLLFIALFPFSLVAVGAVALIRKRRKNRVPKLELIREDLSERPLNGRYSQDVDECKKQKSEIDPDAVRVSVSSKHAVKRKKKRKQNRGKRK